MNAKTFGKKSLTFSVDDAVSLARAEFNKLQKAIFNVVPEGCFLKMWKVLDLKMTFMLSPIMMDDKRISSKDICALCSATACPHNDVSHKNWRIIKVKILGRIFNK